MLKFLKNKRIKEKKPKLILKPNHYHYISEHRKVWTSIQAFSDKLGGYVPYPIDNYKD